MPKQKAKGETLEGGGVKKFWPESENSKWYEISKNSKKVKVTKKKKKIGEKILGTKKICSEKGELLEIMFQRGPMDGWRNRLEWQQKSPAAFA